MFDKLLKFFISFCKKPLVLSIFAVSDVIFQIANIQAVMPIANKISSFKILKKHVCRPLFSIVQYSQEKTGWSVTSFDPAVFYSGSWGSPMSELDVVEIGYGSFAIREQSGFFQAGYTEDYISFISRIKDKYVEIFSIMKTVTNGLKPDGEPKNCTLDVNIIPIGTSYYEIKTSSDGSDECPKVREETYFFNGKRYVSKGAHEPQPVFRA